MCHASDLRDLMSNCLSLHMLNFNLEDLNPVDQDRTVIGSTFNLQITMLLSTK